MQERRAICCGSDHACVVKRGPVAHMEGLVLEAWTISIETGEKAENRDPGASRRVDVVGSCEAQCECE